MSCAAKGRFSSTSEKHGKQTIASFCEYNFATALIAGLTSAAFKWFFATECHRKPARSARQLGLEFWRRFSISHVTLTLHLALILYSVFFFCQVERQLTEEQINGNTLKHLWRCHFYFDCNTTKL